MKIAYQGCLYESVTGLPFPIRGEIAIPEGYTRMYHQTNPDNVESIEQNGLLLNRSRGKSVGDPIGVWATTDPEGFYGKQGDLATVEFKIPTKEYETLHGGSLIQHDISPEDIIAIHEPWKDSVNFMARSPETINDVKAGEYDTLVNDDRSNKYNKAIQYIKEHL